MHPFVHLECNIAYDIMTERERERQCKVVKKRRSGGRGWSEKRVIDLPCLEKAARIFPLPLYVENGKRSKRKKKKSRQTPVLKMEKAFIVQSVGSNKCGNPGVRLSPPWFCSLCVAPLVFVSKCLAVRFYSNPNTPPLLSLCRFIIYIYIYTVPYILLSLSRLNFFLVSSLQAMLLEWLAQFCKPSLLQHASNCTQAHSRTQLLVLV